MPCCLVGGAGCHPQPGARHTMRHGMLAVGLALAAVVTAAATSPTSNPPPAQCAGNITKGLGLGGEFARLASVQTFEDCCAICTADPQCRSWTWRLVSGAPSNNCSMRYHEDIKPNPNNKPSEKVSGQIFRTDPPTPSPPAPPSPVPAGSQKNIVFIINDDQDLMMGSLRAMPNTVRLLGEGGANLTQFRVNTPICCPSRATMMSGRYEHNNKVAQRSDGGCMYQNTSRSTSPDFWLDGHIKRLHDEHGYTTGMFGKVLNTWDTYGCKGNPGMPPGLDHQLVMCNHNYFNNSWVNMTDVIFTGDRPEDYTTSVMGNASLAWIKSVLDMGKTHPPFYAWIGPHAPHLPSIPAPWYEDHPIGLLKAPRQDPRYNYSAADHHPLIAVQDVLTEQDADAIDGEYSKRMRTLLSVDDIVVDLHSLLTSYGEWDNTFVIFSSDHGYSLGQYRVPTHKMQVYDNCLRVPFFVKGPGITPGQQIEALTQFADLGPTLLQFAGSAKTPSSMDGRSWAPLVVPSLKPTSRPWRTEHLASYQTISDFDCNFSKPRSCGHHPIDGLTNTHRSIRIVNSTHKLMYAEFTNAKLPDGWDFLPDSIEFHELYDMANDPWQLHNLYDSTSQTVKEELALILSQAYQCSGASCP